MPRAASLVFAALPFAFGAIRAVKTGEDVRYLWVALAAAAGAFAMAKMTHALRPSVSTPVLAIPAFLASAAVGVAAAMLLGTKPGPGILVVAGSFAACFAVACLLGVFGPHR